MRDSDTRVAVTSLLITYIDVARVRHWGHLIWLEMWR